MSHNELDLPRRTAKIETGPQIAVLPSGFSSSDVHVYEGQVVTFAWDGKSKRFMNSSDGQNVVQVVSVDRTDVKVPGGYQSGPITKNGEYSIQFNLAGKYTFINEGAKKKAAPLNVTVEARQHYNVVVTDGGFKLKVITIDQGNWINFVWTNCQIPHSVAQLKFCDRHRGFTVKKQRGVVPIPSGSYKHEFRHPGIYYFWTQQATANSDICVVQVHHVTREYMVDVKDRRFEPMILLIEENDKVWFRWDDTRDAHCVYQIAPPSADQPAADEYQPVNDGFKWHEPTTTGLLAHQFNEPGVYYYTDRDFSHAASYIGTIIVKPRQKEHFIRVQPSAYTPALLPATTGDRIWWQWTPSEMQKAFALKQIEQCLSPLAKDVKDDQCGGSCKPMTERQIITFCKAGVQSTVVNSIGIYHYKIPEVVDVLPTSSLLVESGDKNFTVKVDDDGFTPRIATIGPGCRVWFIWQGTQNQHNIQQVSYEGVPVNGFNSGATRDSPSAFMHQFHTPGVYYFVSKSLPRLFGAVIVATQPQVHAINVRTSVKPDPLSVAENDVVYWAFNEEKRHDITQIHSLGQAVNMPHSKLLPPRLIMNRVFADYGVYHFTGPAMIDHTRHGSSSSIEAEDLRISSVIVDEDTDKNCVRVDSTGFHPRNITIKKGDSVLWSWRKEREQEHNIVHVNTPDSESPLSVVKGKKAFNSGKPVKGNSYMHTFDDIGYFCVASQGAPGYAGSVTVIGNVRDDILLKSGKKVQTPYIDYTEQMGGSVELNHQVELKCATQNAMIYYTIDGSIPSPWHKQAQEYDPKTGVVLKYPGLCFIRACAVHDEMVDSEIFVSRRFAVDEKPEGSVTDSESVDYTPIRKEAHRLWLMCEPRIRAYLLPEPGEMNIVWNELTEQCMHIVKGYRLYINGIIYCTSFPASYSVANVSGLAGGNAYEVVLECLPKDPALVPLRSNRVNLRCSERVESGGPLISLERSSKSDELIVVWKNVSTQSYPFRGYLVYLNNVECGSMIVPEVHQHKCRAVISTHAGVRYSVMVAAVPIDHSLPRRSNELFVTLPLDCSEVVLPPQELRAGNNPDIYKEYLEVRDGNSDPSSVASDSSDTATETDTSITPRTEGRLRATLKKSLSRSSNRSHAKFSQPKTSARGRNKSERDLSHPLPEIIPPIVFHADFGVSDDLSIMKDFVCVVQPGVNIASDSHVYEAATSGVNGGNGVIANPESVTARKAGVPAPARKKVQLNVAAVAATGTSTLRGTIQPPEGVSGKKSGGNPRRKTEISSEESSGSTSSEESTGSSSSSEEEATSTVVVAGNASISKILSTPQSRHGSRSSSRAGSRVASRSPSPNHAAKAQRLDSSLERNKAAVVVSHQPPLVVASHQPVKRNVSSRRKAAVAGRPVKLMADTRGKCVHCEKDRIRQTPSGKGDDCCPSDCCTSCIYGNSKPPPTQQFSEQGKRQMDSPSSSQVVSHTPPVRASSNTFQVIKEESDEQTSDSSSATMGEMVGDYPPPVTSTPRQASADSVSRQTPQRRGSQQQQSQRPLQQRSAKMESKEYSSVPPEKFSRAPGVARKEEVFAHPTPVTYIIAPNGHFIPAPTVDQPSNSAADLAMAGIRVMNSPPANVGRMVESPKPVEHVIVPSSATFERAPSRPVKSTAEVEVHAGAHDVFLPVREREIIQPLLVPMDSVLDPEEPVLTAEATPASPKATFVAPPEGYKLPVPIVHIEHVQGGGELVKWELSALPDMAYKLTSFAINVIGESFTTNVNSDISFECIVNSDGEKINLLQHVWNVTGDHTCRIDGLADGSTYRIYVAANWTFLAGNYPRDTQSKSIEFDYTTVGAPQPPVLKATKTELLNQVTIEWSPAKENSIPVAGYKVLLNGTSDFTINGEPASRALPPNCTQTTIDRLVPGRTVKVQVIAVTNHPVGDSRPSNTLNVTCPALPEPPLIVNQPSYKKGVVVIAWDAPKPSVVGSPGHAANITYYSIYVDGVWHGEIKANQASDTNGYQYYMTDLKPGVSYDVFVKSIAGQKVPEGSTIFSLCESNLSNIVPVTCAAPPASPHIYIESMTPQGIDITWEVPQQYGDAVLSGYQLIKNGSIYGSTIPPEVTSMSIKDVTLGDDIKLQIIALTEHPVGGSDTSAKDRGDGRYAECKPGPKLSLQYTGLVSPVTKLWMEKVTGHHVLLVWKHKRDRQKAHFLSPDSYQVTWWPGDVPEGHINSCSTSDDHLHIQDLTPNTVYTVIVEARRKQHYVALDEMENGPGEEINRHLIISAKSKELTVRTGQPPEPPSNLGVLASTCHSLQIGWDPPRERGVEVKLVRVDCIPVHKKVKTHVCEELLPSETVINLHNLCEHTEYDIVITAVTEEFFESLPLGHEWKKDRQIPHNNVEMPDNEWLPKSTITVRTSGTEPPTDLTLKKVSDTSAELNWNPSVVFGNNRLLSYVVRWTRLDPNAAKENEHYMEHMNLHKRETTATISSLVPGFQYRIVVEAVVSVKTAIEAIDGDEDKNRRTTHIPSMPLLVRARAPVQPPVLLLTGYTPSTASLFWDKPVLCSVVARDAEGAPVYVKRYLEGYRLYINGKLHMRLDNSAQSLTLTKCKPGKTYDISLVALTSTEAARREKKRGIRSEDDSDESLSMPITVSLPTIYSGNFENINAAFVEESNKEAGSIHVKWNVQSHSKDIKQWNVIWYEREEGMLHKTGVEPHNNSCIIPVDKRKRIYEVSIEPDMYGQMANPPTQRMQVVTPGPVDPPEIFLRCVNEKDFTIEWGEPRCYGGVKVKGYQLYMNDKKIGHVLSSTHRKAVIPCRPNRQYKVCMYAIGSEYGNSTTSNSLLINTPGSRFAAGQLLDSSIVDFESWEASDQTDLKVRSSQVTDTSMKIDWVYENKPRNIKAYKVVWSCSTQPKDREVRVDTGEAEYSLVLQKLFPGITHYIKVFAIGESDVICEKSKQIIVQTSAPPDTPVIGVRACNLKYVSIHWEKPKCYGSAHITGYRVYVDGICEAVNGPDQLIYNYTSGKFCTEYSFQVQAITDNDLSSKPSDPLLVKWPGIIPPTIRQLPAETNSSLKLGWEIPYCTEGIKLKHYKVVCKEGDTEKVVQTVSPIHPETTQAELYNVRKGTYQIYLEIYLHNASEIFRTDAISVEPFIFPDPPIITVTIVGLEERRQLEKVTADLVNKRYRLMSVLADGGKNEGVISGHKFKRTEIVHAQAKAKDYLIHIDEMLDDCFQSLSNLTGALVVHVSWTSTQSSQDVSISGYRVLVDRKQFGTTLHAGVNNVRLKLNLDVPVHRISMVAVSAQPHGLSDESNTVEVLTAPFRPFVAFCYHNIHQPSERWPNPGCCRYDASVNYERQQKKMKPTYKGLLHKQLAPPQVNVLDVFECEFKPLLPLNGPDKPTILLFWNSWCLASQRNVEFMFKFSQFNNHKYDFISLACGLDVTVPQERADLVHCIASNGWNDHQAMWHVTDQSASTVIAAQSFIKQNLLGADGKRLKNPANGPQIAFGNMSDLLGLTGVPSIVVIHPANYIAWMGAFCAYDQQAFDVFIDHIMAETLNINCPVDSCVQCQSAADLFGLLSARHTQKGQTQTSPGLIETQSQIVRRPPSSKKPRKHRPQSAKTPSVTPAPKSRPLSASSASRRSSHSSSASKNSISVARRPYSATPVEEDRESANGQPISVNISRRNSST